MDLQRQHLEEFLTKNYELQKNLEDSLLYETHPVRQSDLQNHINRIKQRIKEGQQELAELSQKNAQYSSNQPQSFVEDLGYGVKLEMIYIPGGTFRMGAPEDEEGSDDNERPRHQVNVQPFYMGKYTVTQEQWEKVADFFPQVNQELEPHPSRFKGDKLPVEFVSWYDAVEFCARLTQRTDRNYRLPSEAEWEYACRAGSAKPFSFGYTITTDVVNYNGNSYYCNSPTGQYRRQTTPVGTFPPNAFGLYDMHGNVWEWCADNWHDTYQDAPTDSSAWINENDNQYSVLRGGCWSLDPISCRSASRQFNFRAECELIYETYEYDYEPNHDTIGFRVVCGVGMT